MVAKYATNASGAMLLLNLIQVTESISGSVVPLAMFSSCSGSKTMIFCRIFDVHGLKVGDAGSRWGLLGVNTWSVGL